MNDLINIAQMLIVMGWFWLIVYTIHRSDHFKKRYFTVFLAIYFIHGILKVAELIQFEYDPDAISLLSILSNVLCIFGFVFFTERHIKFKHYEKTISTTADHLLRIESSSKD